MTLSVDHRDRARIVGVQRMIGKGDAIADGENRMSLMKPEV